MKKIYLTLATALFFTITYSQNECSTATVLAETGQFGSVAGDTSSSGDNGGSNTTNDVWYIISPGAAQTINTSLWFTSTGYDFKLTVYSGGCGSLDAIATNDDSVGLNPVLSFQSEVGLSYYIVVEGSDNPFGGNADNGPFSISTWYEAGLTPPSAPTGLDCSGTPSGSTVFYTDELDGLGGWTGDIVATQMFDSWEIGTAKGSHSPDTGPSTFFSGTSYMSFDSEGGSVLVSAVSPAIDLTDIAFVEDAELTFYMHAYGVDMGNLDVYVGTSNSSPVGGPSLFTWSGQWQSIDSQDWVQVGIDISSHIGDVIYVEFRFENKPGSTAGDFHTDMAIDLLNISVCDTALSINEESVFENLTLYPNPTTGLLNFRAQDAIENIRAYNLLGQEVLRSQPRVLNTQVNMTDLPTGVYIVKVQIGNQISTYKIVKQ